MKTQVTPQHTRTVVAAPDGVRRIVLIGFMGAGKTSVGRLLAAELGWTFLDLDAHLEARAGRSVRAIFAAEGEAHFRRLESSALASALGAEQTVLALGGGTPEELTNTLLLEQTPGTLIVYLDAPFATLYDRCMLEELSARQTSAGVETVEPDFMRPVLSSPADAEARFRRRSPLYRRLARLTVSTAEQSATDAVGQLLALFSAM